MDSGESTNCGTDVSAALPKTGSSLDCGLMLVSQGGQSPLLRLRFHFPDRCGHACGIQRVCPRWILPVGVLNRSPIELIERGIRLMSAPVCHCCGHRCFG